MHISDEADGDDEVGDRPVNLKVNPNLPGLANGYGGRGVSVLIFDRQPIGVTGRILSVERSLEVIHCLSGRATFYIFRDHLFGPASRDNSSVFEQNAAAAKFSDGLHAMADEKYRAPLFRDSVHLTKAFLLESQITNGEYFVYDKNF